MYKPSITINADGTFKVPDEVGEWVVFNHAGREVGVIRSVRRPESESNLGLYLKTFYPNTDGTTAEPIDVDTSTSIWNAVSGFHKAEEKRRHKGDAAN